jgi:aquaporin Z
VLGAIFGGLLGYIISENTAFPHVADHINSVQAFIGEAVFTALLTLVFLTTTSSQQLSGNTFYGVAIGFTVGVNAFCIGGMCSFTYTLSNTNTTLTHTHIPIFIYTFISVF